MFYDTTIWWSDDTDTQRLKTYKQQANHYETLRDTLNDKLLAIGQRMDSINTAYTFKFKTQSTDYDDRTSYNYMRKNNATRTRINDKLHYYEDLQRSLDSLRQSAENLYSQYYDLAIREGGSYG